MNNLQWSTECLLNPLYSDSEYCPVDSARNPLHVHYEYSPLEYRMSTLNPICTLILSMLADRVHIKRQDTFGISHRSINTVQDPIPGLGRLAV